MSASNNQTGCGCSIGLSGIIAGIISYALNGSFWWAVFHSICGVFYIIYAVIWYHSSIGHALKQFFGM